MEDLEKDLEILDWAYAVGESENDFSIEWEVDLPPLFNMDNIRYEYNQGRSVHCTLYWPMWAISDLFNYEFKQENIDAIIALSVERGKPINIWRNTQLGVKCACDYWNSISEQKVVYYRVDVKSLNFIDAIKKWYTVVVTYRGNSTYGMDVYDNACVDGTEFPNPTYGHCTTSIWMDDTGIKDSYKGRKGKGWIDTNRYKLSDLKKLVDNGVFYPVAYLILPQQTKSPEEIKRLMTMKAMITQKMDLNSQLRYLTTDERFKEELHGENNICREKLIDIELELKKL